MCHTSPKPVQEPGACQSIKVLLSGLIGTLIPPSPAALISHVISRWLDAAGGGLMPFLRHAAYRMELIWRWYQGRRDAKEIYDIR